MLTELEADREETTYLEDNLQEMLTELEVDREDNNVLGR